MMPGRYNPHRSGYKVDWFRLGLIVAYFVFLGIAAELIYDGLMLIRALLR